MKHSLISIHPRFAAVLFLALFGVAAGSSAQPKPQTFGFEGNWMENPQCTLPADAVEYQAGAIRFNGLQMCNYDTDFGTVRQVATNHWILEATCLISFNEEDENGDTLRRNRDAITRIELKLNGERLTQSLRFDSDLPDTPTDVTEYYRCDKVASSGTS